MIWKTYKCTSTENIIDWKLLCLKIWRCIQGSRRPILPNNRGKIFVPLNFQTKSLILYLTFTHFCFRKCKMLLHVSTIALIIFRRANVQVVGPQCWMNDIYIYIHWASKEISLLQSDAHFINPLNCIKFNHILTQLSYSSPYEAHLKN